MRTGCLRLVAIAGCAAVLAGCSGGRPAAVTTRPPARPAPGALDPQHLPALPRELLAVERGDATALVRLDGSLIGRLDGYGLVPDNRAGLFVSGGGWSVLSRSKRRLVSVPMSAEARASASSDPLPSWCPQPERIGSHNGDDILGCSASGGPGTIAMFGAAGLTRIVLAPQGARSGRWTLALGSPHGERLLLEWTGRCRTAGAYLAPMQGGVARPVAPAAASVPLGWSRDGRAFVLLARSGCRASRKPPGVYAVGADGRTTLVARGGGAQLLHLSRLVGE